MAGQYTRQARVIGSTASENRAVPVSPNVRNVSLCDLLPILPRKLPKITILVSVVSIFRERRHSSAWLALFLMHLVCLGVFEFLAAVGSDSCGIRLITLGSWWGGLIQRDTTVWSAGYKERHYVNLYYRSTSVAPIPAIDPCAAAGHLLLHASHSRGSPPISGIFHGKSWFHTMSVVCILVLTR